MFGSNSEGQDSNLSKPTFSFSGFSAISNSDSTDASKITGTSLFGSGPSLFSSSATSNSGGGFSFSAPTANPISFSSLSADRTPSNNSNPASSFASANKPFSFSAVSDTPSTSTSVLETPFSQSSGLFTSKASSIEPGSSAGFSSFSNFGKPIWEGAQKDKLSNIFNQPNPVTQAKEKAAKHFEGELLQEINEEIDKLNPVELQCFIKDLEDPKEFLGFLGIKGPLAKEREEEKKKEQRKGKALEEAAAKIKQLLEGRNRGIAYRSLITKSEDELLKIADAKTAEELLELTKR